MRYTGLAAGLTWIALLAFGMAVHHPLKSFPLFPQGIDPFRGEVFAAVWGDHLLQALALGVWLLALAAWGKPVRVWSRTLLSRSPLSTHVELGLGFGLAGLAVLGLGLAGLLYPAVLGVVVAVPWLALRRDSGPAVSSVERLAQRGWRRIRLMLETTQLLRLTALREHTLWKLAVGVPVLLALPEMLSPEGSWDAMVYHLRLPSFYLMEHKLFLVSDSPFAGFPALSEMHYLLALALTGADRLPKLMHAACWLLTARLLFVAARPFSVAAGYGTALIWLLSPLGIHLAGIAYNDHAVAWLTTLCVVLIGVKSSCKSRFLLAGVFAGLAFAVKYTGAFAGVGLLACWAARRQRPVPSFGLLGCAIVGAAAPAAVWLARRWLCLGNPVYPFFGHALGGMPSAMLDFWMANPPTHTGGGWTALLLRPWIASVADDGGVGAVLSPLWLAVFIPAACTGRLNVRWSFFAAGAVAWWVLPLDSRFLLPLIPAALLAVLPAWQDRTLAVLALAAAAVLAPFCLQDAARASFLQYDTLPPALGLRSREEHLRAGLMPQPEYWETAREINRRTPRHARLLLVGGFKSYYIDRRCSVPHQHYDPVPLLRELRGLTSPERLAIRFRQLGYTHLVYLARAATVIPDLPGAEMSATEAERYVAWLRRSTAYEFRRGESLVYTLRRRRQPRELGRVPLLEEFAMKEVTERKTAGAMDRLARLAPESSSLAMARGVRVVLNASADPSEALRPLSAAVRDPESSPIAWRALGFVLERQGESGRALACYQRAIELNPSDAEAHFNAGQLLTRFGRWEPAYQELAIAVRLEPGRQEFRRALQEVLQRTR